MAIHSQFTGEELHEAFHYVQETDPGAVGSGKYWLKVSTGDLKRRKSDNTGWDAVGNSTGMTDPTTTKGDLITRSASAVARLPVGSNGQVVTADSTQTLGIKWATPSNGGDITLLSQTILSSSATNISIAIPGGYKDLKISGLFRSDNASDFDEVIVNFNADTTDANYVSSILYGGSSAGNTNNAYAYFGNSSGATSTSGLASQWTTHIANYLSTTFNKVWSGNGNSWRSTSSHFTFNYGGGWKNAAAITNLLVKPKFGTNWITGTILNIWGLK